MVIAVLSDVHGNAPALAAVLAEVDRQSPDLILNLGDVASGAVDPRATLDLLRGRGDIATVRGNHDRQLLELTPQRMGGVDRLAHATLTDEDRSWLARLPPSLEPASGVLAVHGAPGDDLHYLLETVTPAGLREATDAEVTDALGAEAGRHRLYLCGHTHLQRTRVLPDGSIVVNPGSVGWPAFCDDHPFPHRVEAGSPHARYTTVRLSGGEWTASHHQVRYDVDAAASLAERNGRADIACALRTGRV